MLIIRYIGRRFNSAQLHQISKLFCTDTSKCVSWQNKGLTWLYSVDMFVALVVKCSGLVTRVRKWRRISSIPT